MGNGKSTPEEETQTHFHFPFLRTEENKKRRKAVFTPFFLFLSFPFPSFRENAPLKKWRKKLFYFPSLGRCMSVLCYMRNRKGSIFFFFFFYFSLASVLWKSRKCFSPRKNAVQKKNLPVRIVGRKHGTNRFRTVLYRLHLREVFLKIGRGRLETPPKTETTENGEREKEEETHFFINLGKPLCVQLQD